MPLIQYGPALGVGVVGENELLDFDALDEIDESGFLERMNAVLPDGLRFVSLVRLPAGSPSLIKVVNRAQYAVVIDAPEIVDALDRVRHQRADLEALNSYEIHGRLAGEFMSRGSVVIERARRDKRLSVDVRRYTISVSLDRLLGSLSIVTELTPNGIKSGACVCTTAITSGLARYISP